MAARIQEYSIITCPACGHEQLERMPLDACEYYYECTSCFEMLRPKPGDCCVYCSYGSVKCPIVQLADDDAAVDQKQTQTTTN